MSINYWLVKQEPADYAWSQFVADGRTAWTGVRNFQARNHLRAMQRGDQVLYYHSGEEKQVVGIAQVEKAAYPDPTTKEEGWVAVDLKPLKPLPGPVSLAAIKADPALSEIALVRQSRLSVMPLSKAHFQRVLALAPLGSRK